MAPPPLVAVAHGSRDPRSARAIAGLLDVVRAKHSELDVRAAFLDLSAPRLLDVLSALHAEGHREVVVAPLLLGNAYHARVDVPAMVAEATTRLPRLSVSVADVLGPDARLETVALHRLRAATGPRDDGALGVVLAAAGSSHRPANTAVSAVARRWAARHGWAGAIAAFAAAAEPDVATAIRRLRARGARRIAVGSWFLAPGLLPDRIAAKARAADPDVVIAEPLGAAPALAELVLDRYHEARISVSTLQYA
ncbi:MAG TPA: sirohydrochlorin chelatase [Actinophytocola sp.]|uniref:sirohydrochlorin chelatase n=1 Tax=Actinophytocola sp. TaxID=1872138 RepID=UPI002DDD1D69|nr:sirohydrochlorin chelatase [Actinophytocola sp.]HEV2782221.1 sirohydrochlorin chelatase [Actinophytocola sp.]